MSYTQWKIPYGATPVPAALLEEGFSPLLAAILYKRGLSDRRQARRFIDCSKELLGDPLMMTDMPQAVRRLSRAIAEKERVAVYGDYDVDGITSSSLLGDYLRSRGLPCEIYIPDRQEEGYGVNCGAIDVLHQKGVSLIITVDCGVTAVEECAYAAALGIDMIITDHHECQDILPDAIAVVDPKRPDCHYPSRDLAGVGVAFKLLCALEGNADAILARYADLVAVGTIADVMPLVGENRYIIKAGLEKLSSDPRPGLRALIDESGLSSRRITATNVGYTLAPRLNASGRLGQASFAARLLLIDSPQQAARCAAELCQLNRERQAIELEIWEEAVAMLDGDTPRHPIVLAREDWHQGVIGIAASRLTEAYNLPAIMICLDGENGKGSCRSYGGFNLFEALSACSEYLEGFGGHALAAGLTIRRENIPAFRQALARYYDKHPPCTEKVLDIDIRVDRAEFLDMHCVEDLERLEPCGNGNPSAQLCLDAAVLEAVTPIAGGKHLRLRLGKFGRSFDAVFFSRSAESLGLRPGALVDAAFFPQINEFRGRRSVQLLMSDLRPHDDSAALRVLRGEGYEGPVPEREDFVRLWRSLLARGGSLQAPLSAVCETLAPGMWDAQLCLCLKVFEELQLLDLAWDGSHVRLCRRAGNLRVDLADSRILQDLQQRKEPKL